MLFLNISEQWTLNYDLSGLAFTVRLLQQWSTLMHLYNLDMMENWEYSSIY